MHIAQTPNSPPHCLVLLCLLGLAALAASPARAGVVQLAPQYAGRFAAGTGADATFLQVDSQWHGSTVVWKDPNPIGTYSWGNGLWGRADWLATQQAGQGLGGPPIVNSWSGTVSSINFGNAIYNNLYSGTWGPAAQVPFFPATPVDAKQENWTSSFSGFIRITEADEYNFGVLNDDGFFFRLIGAGGQALEIGRDFLNPRERNGFGDDLDLGVGLYGFELGMWNREEAGVVDLRWNRGGGEDWTLVPVTNLLGRNQIPEPGSLPLLLLAGAGLWIARRRRPNRLLHP